MQILTHFNLERTDKLYIYRLRPDATEAFISEITTEFRRCYIEDEDLEEISFRNQMSKADFLEKYVVPDIGNIKSGDFGEILSFFSMLENSLSKRLLFSGPHKWLWKDRNKAAQYTDAVAFHVKELGMPSTQDILVSIESKMKATKQAAHRIQDAIDGANKDRLDRLAKTLLWLQEKYARIGDLNNRKLVERFIDPSLFGTYIKVFKAMAILDSEFEEEELSLSTTGSEGIVVVVFSLANLKLIYERNRQNMFESVKP